ncbi:MAG: XisI protein [Oscillatoria sp. SIO1A7]|nr:XisI protein [Oscillatoria sp. SIO1A7]
MDKLERYRESIKTILKEYADRMKNSEFDVQLICDNENDHYLLLDVGWQKSRRVHSCALHFDIIDGKIWLQENNTELEIDRDLEEMGISKKEIVVGFHHPSMREYSDYAVS